jgi:hypothetical protein
MHFMEALMQRPLKEEEITVSFDIPSLFIKVPVDWGLTVIEKRLQVDGKKHSQNKLMLPLNQ